ncbi:transmembrane protein, putative (macronuclear) [Tetrahymena thermophila SB210]|uniref:Transmembrane protein, putative n=1 Tax=Tetrahymena thermophila (strain SB210) TaxID=312017 RepID=W7XCG7_TETTS|nr:transmembrane protein, putative [Tetrahymena thermophila SB210]EWS74253.1 transmembrane protein, putative [Tetrahymena thermophila SB210]|eukprot:XP_012653226.1 transmembrane protein, putative [Tetrahymena thermophila SB210]
MYQQSKSHVNEQVWKNTQTLLAACSLFHTYDNENEGQFQYQCDVKLFFIPILCDRLQGKIQRLFIQLRLKFIGTINSLAKLLNVNFFMKCYLSACIWKLLLQMKKSWKLFQQIKQANFQYLVNHFCCWLKDHLIQEMISGKQNCSSFLNTRFRNSLILLLLLYNFLFHIFSQFQQSCSQLSVQSH